MELSNIRYDQKDFKYTAVRLEIKKVQKIKPLYEFGKLFLPTLNISKNSIGYYADLTHNYSTVSVGTNYLLAPEFKSCAEVSSFILKGRPEFRPDLSEKKTRGTVALIGAKLSL
jgi:hypothetical protein